MPFMEAISDAARRIELAERDLRLSINHLIRIRRNPASHAQGNLDEIIPGVVTLQETIWCRAA